MKLLNPAWLTDYCAQLPFALKDALGEVAEAVNTGSETGAGSGAGDLMRLYESAVCSSQIEGSKMTLSLFRDTMEAAGDRPKPRDVQEVADLVSAYRFAQQQPLNSANLLEAHRILSALLLTDNDRGAWRSKGVKVGNAYTTVYMAPHQSMVPDLMAQLMEETGALLSQTLTIEEAFYYASYLHLAFVNVHPFIDGNGRCARLLEKWFLAHHIGPIAWSIRSEKYIINHRDEYYDALASLGAQWGTLDYSRCIPFLLLLPAALKNK